MKATKTHAGSDGSAALAKSVINALQFLHCRGSGMLLRENVAKHWTEHFCDSLEAAGYEVDRDAVKKHHKLK